ncbi:hypothetical protein WOSG25_110060 [Weissella oryzae SG25]|uniref:Uncharacterized protein n=1 Tax=Weissella oryzae (strain DSM 25784 / JCM 18191 / LMG 30913 / SG25) TaxID=1329250 RepID=A0A069CWC5_WEIOS|nr:hypothetical protein [Weissella oryzae]GAK31528.1 hypothetical protein WOSG25_110060 [Weissella oryzae SG25]
MEKYKVSSAFFEKLYEWAYNMSYSTIMDENFMTLMPALIRKWWEDEPTDNHEKNNRLIALTFWFEGVEIFEKEN